MKTRLYQEIVVRSWWVVLFLILCYGFTSYGMHKKKLALAELQARCQILEETRKKELERQEELVMQIQSQNDPSWIEMMLMKGLGLVPKGQVKVYFEKQEASQQPKPDS